MEKDAIGMISGNGSTPTAAPDSGGRRLRIVLYGQSLSGTGHFVRIYEIARALATRHDVHLIDGGRPVPRPRAAYPLTLLAVPRICRRERLIVPVDAGVSLDAVMAERRRTLTAALERIQPDALVVEHFPFSKWSLRDEIVTLIEHARRAAPWVRVLASVRDIPPGTGDDPGAPSYRDDVLRTLREHFDGLLVHADPALVAFEEHIPWAGEIPVPMAATGYVSEKLGDRSIPGRGHVIVSTGGAHLPDLVERSVEAWQRLEADGAAGGRRLMVFLPPFGPTDPPPAPAGNPSIRVEPFTADFLPWMAGADLSISQAGYNTCTNVLETGARAILVPSGRMSDQAPRARRLAERGLARTIRGTDLDVDRLAAAMRETLSRPAVAHAINLDGAERTRELIEQWCAEPISVAPGAAATGGAGA
jgi:predicted glycosyltransferase